MNQFFLYSRDLFKRYFNTHISSCYHYTVSSFKDFVYIFNTLKILDFCYDSNVKPAETLSIFSQVIYISGSSDKACGNKIILHFCGEFQIVHIGIAEIRHRKLYSGNVDTFVIWKLASVNYTAFDFCSSNFFCKKFNNAVVYKYSCAHWNIGRQLFKRNTAYLICTETIFGSQRINIAVFNFHRLVVNKSAQSYFRSLGIHHCSNGKIQFRRNFSYLFNAILMVLVASVRKVESGNIHTMLHKLFYHFLTLCYRTDRTNNFCFSHLNPPEKNRIFLIIPFSATAKPWRR